MKNMKVVILCGGKGTRSYPFTELFPKVMMPINGTPIIVHLMKIYAAQGVTDFILAAGHRKEMLIDYFEGRFSQWNIRIIDTGEDADTGDRVLRCREHVEDRFFVTYGDGLGDVDLTALLATHRRSGGLATLTTVPLRSQYGHVFFNGEGKVLRFEEKPVIEDCWINAGFFVFEKEAMREWRGHNLESDVLADIAQRGRLFVHRHRGFWKSMDTSKDQHEMEKAAAGRIAPWTIVPPGTTEEPPEPSGTGQAHSAKGQANG